MTPPLWQKAKELKSLLIKVKIESENIRLKLQKAKRNSLLLPLDEGEREE